MARQHRANWERADQARKAMDAVGFQDDPEADVSDLLTNLRHYCDSEKLDFDQLVERSAVHHDAEVQPDDLEMSSRAARKRRR